MNSIYLFFMFHKRFDVFVECFKKFETLCQFVTKRGSLSGEMSCRLNLRILFPKLPKGEFVSFKYWLMFMNKIEFKVLNWNWNKARPDGFIYCSDAWYRWRNPRSSSELTSGTSSEWAAPKVLRSDFALALSERPLFPSRRPCSRNYFPHVFNSPFGWAHLPFGRPVASRSKLPCNCVLLKLGVFRYYI